MTLPKKSVLLLILLQCSAEEQNKVPGVSQAPQVQNRGLDCYKSD